jgi:hypothetical protein
VTSGTVELIAVSGAHGRLVADLEGVHADARRAVADDDVGALQGPGLVEGAVCLERLDGRGRRRRPIDVDRPGVVAERHEVALQLTDIAAIRDAGAEVAIERAGAVEDPGRRLRVDRQQRAAAADGRALGAQAGDRAARGRSQLSRAGVAERGVDVDAVDEVTPLDRRGAQRDVVVGGGRCAVIVGRQQPDSGPDGREHQDDGGGATDATARSATPRSDGPDGGCGPHGFGPAPKDAPPPSGPPTAPFGGWPSSA